VRQVFDRLELRTRSRTIAVDLREEPFCTFDYRAFTRGLLDQCSGVTFRRAVVTALTDGAVQTTEGTYRARVVVDASGWRGLALNGADARPGRAPLSFGLETRTDLEDDRLILILDDRVISHGIGWIFPVGRGSLVGLGSYDGASKLGAALTTFLAGLAVRGADRHGTFFPNRLLRATSGSAFAVGDAAGQCLPLTAEGIRPALYFGGECGRHVDLVLRGERTLAGALRDYERLVERYRGAYRILRLAQLAAVHLPNHAFTTVASVFTRAPLLARWWPRYARFGVWDGAHRRMAPVGTRSR